MGVEEGYVRRYKKGDVIPDGAIFLDQESILKIQNKKLEQLSKEKLKSVLPIVYGPAVLATAASTSGIYFAHHFQKVLNLSKTGGLGLGLLFTSLVIPSGSIFGICKKGIVPAVITGKVDCTICFETKISLMQTGLGVVYPLVFTWLFSAMTARAQLTYPVPHFGTGSEKLMPFIRATAPKWNPMLFVLMGNISIAMAVGNQMQSCYEKHFMEECDSMVVQRRELFGMNTRK
ncbi:uncharacterized protein LOC117342024 [Pecten maximus]|uniref:uncharacterized protein LOC117342024 n=1 Tax=Pecten maximus TaxID=6579 RepID=UPI0014583112|nr:uncharacterized protein LOC117342024 [Pecten maximus]XP_033759872.1 uncharacterized protein LOC117342024 [Pecten maximus]XP_033759873.1 uncharacterized protein LOC117342024 [Pecten maximus]XP_033759874.1 uncharacterized protein LOC117342024 [Pecten maximus]